MTRLVVILEIFFPKSCIEDVSPQDLYSSIHGMTMGKAIRNQALIETKELERKSKKGKVICGIRAKGPTSKYPSFFDFSFKFKKS